MILEGLLGRAVQMATPLMLGSLGEVLVERTGVMNMAIDGIFIMGAWAGFVGAHVSGSLTVGLCCAVLMGMLVSALYGFLTIRLKQHQIVSGVAINFFMAGLSVYLFRVFFGVPLLPIIVEPLPPLAIPLLSDIPVLGILFRQNILTYAAFILMPLGWYFVFRSWPGLVLRSTGAAPEAVDAAGINVERVQFTALLSAGALSGLAGSFYSIGFLGMFIGDMIGGRAWVAFAICFLGNWNPLGAFAGALAFGLAEAAVTLLQTSNVSVVPNEMLIAMPYILTILATVMRRRFNVPASLGVAFVKERG